MTLARRFPWVLAGLTLGLLGCGESKSDSDASGAGKGGGAESGSGGTAGSAGAMTGGSSNGGSATGGGSANGGSGATGGGAGSGTGGATGGSAGAAGAPTGDIETVLDGLTRPVRLGMKDGYLYFTEMGLPDGSESRLARRDAQGNVETLFTGVTVVALYLDETELFFVERGTKTVYRMPYATLTPEVFVTTAMSVADVARIGDSIWMTEYATSPQTMTAVSIYDLTGALLRQPVAPTATGFIFTYLAFGADTIYISTSGAASALYKLPPNGVGGQTVAEVSPQKIVTDESHVYFTSQNDGLVLRQAHDVDMQPETLAMNQTAPCAITVDTDRAYFTNQGFGCEDGTLSGSVMAVPLAGGTPVPIATGERCPEAILSDGEYVYWTRNAVADVARDDAIVRARKILR